MTCVFYTRSWFSFASKLCHGLVHIISFLSPAEKRSGVKRFTPIKRVSINRPTAQSVTTGAWKPSDLYHFHL